MISSERIIKWLLEDDGDGFIAVDLDGTLARVLPGKYKADKIGDPVPDMVKRVRRWVGHGKKVKIFTARADDEKAVTAIHKWLKDNELPELEVTNLKSPDMIEFWDDRAVAVQKNTGEVKEALDPSHVAWARNLLRMMNDKGIWGVPATGQVFQIDHQAKTLTLIEGPENDDQGWMARLKELFGAVGYRIISHSGEGDEMTVIEAILEELLQESPTIATLEKHRIDLEPDEREQIMKAKAVWPFGKNGADSPAIHKALVKGKHWYWSNTHRLGQVRSTLRAAISAFHKIVEPTA